MKKINSGYAIIFFIFISLLLFGLHLNFATASEKDEGEKSPAASITDSIKKTKPDSIDILSDSSAVPDSVAVADTTQKDTLTHKEYLLMAADTVTVEVDTAHFRHVPYLFNQSLSFPLLASQDSSDIFEYLSHKAYPPKELNKQFLQNKMYQYSDSLDIKTSSAVVSAKIGKAQHTTPYMIPLERYLQLRSKREFDELFKDKLVEFSSEEKQQSGSGGIIPDISFPDVKLPKTMRRLLGDNLGRLSINGSQKITISGRTTVEDPPPVSEGYERNLFPNLQMKQDLNLSISGTIGEKIKVDVQQQSSESFFKKNKLNVKYEGDEDDPIKLIEGGDTRLSLSEGSSLVSYSASSADLFGLKGEFQFGDLNIKTIVSQQEGEQASAQTQGSSLENIAFYKDMDFSHRFFYLEDPYKLFGENIDSLRSGNWTYSDSTLPAEGTLKVFMDDRRENVEDIRGYDQDGNEYAFTQLTQGEDFFINYSYPYLVEIKSVYDNYAIGVTYTDKQGNTVGEIPGGGQPITVKMIKKDYTAMNLEDALWDNLAKNIYFLGSKNMDPEGFGIKITKEKSTGEKVEGVTDAADSSFIKFIDMLDLDSNGNGKLDQGDRAVDLEQGILVLPMLEPFKEYWFRQYNSFWTSGDLGNNIIYKELNPDETEFNPFYIEVKSKTGTSVIDLGHINIIKGSEKVKVDGILMKKGEDYVIDYFSGTVTLKGQASADPNANVTIDYEYRPLMSLDKKTMMGFQADYKFNDATNLGATMMYQIGSSREKHPKIGAEPKHNLVGALDGKVRTEAQFLTDVVNQIPLIRTNEQSNLSLSGEIGMNMPNPNTTDSRQAYIDDMEGVVEELSLGINRPEWHFASYPVGIEDASNVVDTLNKTNRANFWWYNPPDKYDMEDLYPPEELSDEEKRESVPVLECMLKPIHEEPNWSGMMKSTGAVDLSKKKYINIVVKSNAIQGDTLYLNLGYVSEDSYPIFHPNNKWDKEDGIVFEDGELDVGEDVGFDHVLGEDPDPPLSHDTDGDIGESDDGNDDYWYDSENENDFRGLNGTEGNGKLDDEDLNRDKNFSTVNGYYEYALDLANLDITDEIVTNEYNGWKFIKIPLQDSSFYKKKGSTDVNFKIIKYARVWLKRTNVESPDFYDSLLVDFQSISIVGNKWIASSVLDSTLHTPVDISPNEKFEVTAINNRENLNYEPAPGSVIEQDATTGQEILIEQSISLDCENLPDNRFVYARQNFLDAVKLLKYKKVKVWVYGQKGINSNTPDEEIFVFRLGTDTLNYYEYRDTIRIYDDLGQKMQENRWQEITLDFSQFSELKKGNIPDTTANFRIVGEPNLNNTKQVAVGLYRPENTEGEFTGRIIVDDIRVADPYDDMGFATKLSMNAKIADLAQITANLSSETPNFYSIGETSGNNKNKLRYSINNTFNVHKFFPSEWGLNMPLTYNYSRAEETPRFASNSDVMLTTKAEKDSAKIFNRSNLLKLSLKKDKKSENPIVHYLFDNLSFNARIKDDISTSPTSRDTTLHYSGSASYGVSLPSLGFDLYKNKLGFNFLPKKINVNVNYNHKVEDRWKNASGDGVNEFVNEKLEPNRTLKPRININYEFLSDFSTNYSLETTRDLQRRKKMGNVNIGIEEKRSQTLNLNYDPFFLKFLNFSSNYKVDYNQNRQEDVESDSVTTSYYNVNNNRNSSVKIKLAFKDWGNGLYEASSNLMKVEKKDGDKQEQENQVKQNQTNKQQKSQQKQPQKGQQSLNQQEQTKQLLENQQAAGDDTKRRERGQQQKSKVPKQKSGEAQAVQDEGDEKKKKDEGEEKEPKPEEEKVPSRPLHKTILGFSGKMLGGFLKTLGSTSVQYKNSIESRYETSIDSIPQYSYQFGLNDQTYGNFKSDASSDQIDVSQSKNLKLDFLLSGLSSNLKTNYQLKLSKNSGSKNKVITFTLPSVGLTYNGFDDLINSKIFTSTSLQTKFSREISNRGEGYWDTPPKESESLQFYPLLSFNTDLFNKFPITISCNYTHKYEQDNSISNVKNRNNDLNFRTKFKYSFSSPKGIKILFFKRLKMRNELTTNLDISYNINTQETWTPSQGWGYEKDNTTLKVEPRVQYNFSRDIDGGLTISYEVNDENKRNKKTTTTNVSLWVNFRF